MKTNQPTSKHACIQLASYVLYYLPVEDGKDALAPNLALERFRLDFLRKSGANLAQSGLPHQNGHSHEQRSADEAHGQPEETREGGREERYPEQANHQAD